MSTSALLALLLASAAALLAAGEPPRDPDLFWHLASGDRMFATGKLIDHDVFSFSRAGVPYSVGQWLGQLALAGAFGAGGWAGIVLLRAALVGMAVLFVSRAVLRLQPNPAWAVAPILATILVSRLAWGDRPQLFTLTLFPLFFDVLLAHRLGGGTGRALYALPVLMLLWANLHGAFPLGLALIVAFTVEAALLRRREWPRLAGVLTACLLASLATPTLAGGLGWAASYAASPGRAVVEERPTDVLTPAGALFAVLLVLALAASLSLGRERLARRVVSPLLWSGLIVPFSMLGLAITRQLPYACVVLAPFVAAAVPAALGRGTAVDPRFGRRIGAALASAIVVLTAGGAVALAPRAPDLAAYPVDALAVLEARPGNLLHEYDWGGFLIRYAPEHPTFVDGRGAVLFSGVVLGDYDRAVNVAPRYRDVLDRYGISLVLLRPHRPLVAALRESGWPVAAERIGEWILLARP